MLLAIDIGNSHTHFAVFDKDKIINPKSILNTQPIQKWFPQENIRDAIISSVVPAKNELFYKIIKAKHRIEPKFVSAKLLKGAYKELGPDRVANIFGAIYHFQHPTCDSAQNEESTPVCVIDFGTATTIDVFDKKYIGGVIIPGVKLGMEALHSKTALLPEIELRIEERVASSEIKLLGKSTNECIESGIFFGEIYRIKSFISEIKNQIPNIKIISTGGLGKFFYKHLNIPYEEWLTLIGLNSIWKKKLI